MLSVANYIWIHPVFSTDQSNAITYPHKHA